jgi:hypothetical protein
MYVFETLLVPPVQTPLDVVGTGITDSPARKLPAANAPAGIELMLLAGIVNVADVPLDAVGTIGAELAPYPV